MKLGPKLLRLPGLSSDGTQICTTLRIDTPIKIRTALSTTLKSCTNHLNLAWKTYNIFFNIIVLARHTNLLAI